MPFARLLLMSIAAVALLLSAATPAAPPLTDSFETTPPDQPPEDWFISPTSLQAGYTVAVRRAEAHDGEAALAFLFAPADAKGAEAEAQQAPGILWRRIDAAPYRGKRIEYRAAVRAVPPRGGPSQTRVQLWLRVDRPNNQPGFFDNMGDRPITRAAWNEYTIVGDVDDDAVAITFGLMALGGSGAHLDSLSIRILGDAAKPQPPAPLSPRGLENLDALARAVGYIRFFHPSDEAAAADWESLTIRAVREIEHAEDPTELSFALTRIFSPVAPTAVFTPTDGPQPAPPPLPRSERFTGWRHQGLGVDAHPMGIYRSQRITEDQDAPETLPPPGTRIDKHLPGGVRLIMPVTLPVDEQGRTLPSPVDPADAEPLVVSSVPGRDTRLAAIILTWSALQHFYPYFDVIAHDWNAALREALAGAAADADLAAFHRTFSRLIAQLEDGHGSVQGPGNPYAYRLPLGLAWAGENLVVVTKGAQAQDTDIRPGDAILAMDGRPVADLRAELEPLISGSPQWRAYRLTTEITRRITGDPVTITLRRPDGSRAEALLNPVPIGETRDLAETRPESGSELAPGVLYFNLVGAKDPEFRRHLRRLADAKAVIFDMRGYPDNAAVTALRHLFDEGPMLSAQWLIPVATLPDREGVTWNRSSWNMSPLRPRIGGAVVFITDGSAISYAESCMGIVEHYKLGEIVGAPTAGANGNVNIMNLPGAYTIAFTGMKVLKHDGSQHHLVGILPTVPCERTAEGIAAGRDELLERAIEVAKDKIK